MLPTWGEQMDFIGMGKSDASLMHFIGKDGIKHCISAGWMCRKNGCILSDTLN